MGDILRFDQKKKKETPAPPKVKKKNVQILHDKAMSYISWVNSQYKHKFSYPILACRFPKDSHSFDVLYGHCFTSFGQIQKNMDEYPGIALAKKWAVERQDEIIEFLDWRLRKYREAKTLYGKDLIIIDVYIEMFKGFRSHFQELFKNYVRT